jgi:hypothetical protein
MVKRGKVELELDQGKDMDKNLDLDHLLLER